MFRERFLSTFALLAMLFVLSGYAMAQGTTTRITGVVNDSSGAAVSGATVTIQREGLTEGLTAQTNDDGIYVFDLIQPGTYTVSIEKQGFKKFVSSKNVVLVNQPA